MYDRLSVNSGTLQLPTKTCLTKSFVVFIFYPFMYNFACIKLCVENVSTYMYINIFHCVTYLRTDLNVRA